MNAPIEKVWKYWNNPAHIVNWNTASSDWHTPKALNDLRVGGSFCYTMAAKDGSFSFDFAGEYTNVENHSLIAYSMSDGRHVVNKFEVDDKSVKITVTFDPENENPLDMQRDGWQSILDSFKTYTENIDSKK